MTPEQRHRWIDDACDAGYRASFAGAYVLAALGWSSLAAFVVAPLVLMGATTVVLWRAR